MKQLASIVCSALICAMPVVGMAADDQAKPAPQKKKGKVIQELMVEQSALVKAIDLKKRTVTISRADGTDVTLEVGKQVKKLDQVKVGDLVKTAYYESVSVRLKKTRVDPSVTVEEAVERDPKSVKPAGAAVRQVTTIATIDKIYDDGKRAILRGPAGNTLDVKVQDPENLEKIKKGEVKAGDQVEITYTQALAISVEKVAPAKK